VFAASLFALTDAAQFETATAYATDTVVKRTKYHVDRGKGRRNF